LWAQYVLVGSIKCREFIDYLKSCYLLKKNTMEVASASICGMASDHQGRGIEFISLWGYPQRRFFLSPLKEYLCKWKLYTITDHKIQ
jgi:hypothetical protein